VRPESPCGPPITKRPGGGVDVVDGGVIQKAGRLEHRSNDTRDDCLLEFLVANDFIVLVADDHRIDACGLVAIVLDGDLALGIRPQPGDIAVLAHSRGVHQKLVRIGNGCRHQLGCFGTGETEHHALVTGALLTVIETGSRNALADVGALRVNGVEHAHALVVQTVFRAIVTDALGNPARHLLHIDVGVGGDLAADQHHAGSGKSLARDARRWIIAQTGIEYRV